MFYYYYRYFTTTQPPFLLLLSLWLYVWRVGKPLDADVPVVNLPSWFYRWIIADIITMLISCCTQDVVCVRVRRVNVFICKNETDRREHADDKWNTDCRPTIKYATTTTHDARCVYCCHSEDCFMIYCDHVVVFYSPSVPTWFFLYVHLLYNNK